MTFKRTAAALLVALPLLTSCYADDELAPKPAPPIDPIFERYVSLGNSLTAGFQSAGINDSTQRRAYPNLLAAAMGTQFNYPQLSGYGCPSPLTNNVLQTRVGDRPGVPAPPCGARTMVLGYMNNLAFPGAEVAELLDNFGDSPSATDVYKTFLLGGRTEIEVMAERNPTFVSVWAGSNDVLGALLSANPGDPAQVTDPTTWAASYDAVLDAIEAEGADAVLLSVPDVTVIPYASSAAIWYCLKNGGCPPPLPAQDPTLAAIPTFTVNVNCAPPSGVPVLVPWPVGLAKLAAAARPPNTPTSIDCSVDSEVVTASETQGIATAVATYNAHIAAEAAARDLAYLDVNPALQALVADGTIPRFPNIAPALAGQSVGFGPIFSLDGFHISSIAQRIVADSVASVINQHYGTSLPMPICTDDGGPITCPPAP